MSACRRRRRGLRLLLPCLVVGPLLVTRGLAGQAGGGMLFSYEPHAGERASFDEGYRSHLEWHREKEDSLPWYGWDVLAGARLGQFVDGTFGIRFEALDRRVDPGGDAAHASRSYADHARATGRWAVRLRRELSTATPLEDRAPAPLAQVVTYTLPLGYQARFEEALRRVREQAAEAGLMPYTVYESVVGGSDAELTVMVWRNGVAGFERADRDPAVAIRRAVSGELGAALRAESELWRLREDLTLLPDRAAASSEGNRRAPRDGEPAGEIFDASNPENPFRRATVVFVPYCTGDFRLGDRRVTYAARPRAASGRTSPRGTASRKTRSRVPSTRR